MKLFFRIICVPLFILSSIYGAVQTETMRHNIEKSPTKTDTLFEYIYYMPFDVFFDEKDEYLISFLGIGRKLLEKRKYTEIMDRGKLNHMFIEHVFTSKDKLFIGLGSQYTVENLILYDENLNTIDSVLGINVRSVSKYKGTALCYADNMFNKTTVGRKIATSYMFTYDLQRKDTLYKFKDNFLVTESKGFYFEFENKNGEIKVMKYNLKGELLHRFNIRLPSARGIPVYFFNDEFYLTYTPKAYYLFNSKGEEIGSFCIESIYLSKFHVSKSGNLHIFGWFDTDKELESYAFVERVFRLDFSR